MFIHHSDGDGETEVMLAAALLFQILAIGIFA